MRFWTNCFFSFNKFFLPKKKSKRCERKPPIISNLNPAKQFEPGALVEFIEKSEFLGMFSRLSRRMKKIRLTPTFGPPNYWQASMDRG